MARQVLFLMLRCDDGVVIAQPKEQWPNERDPEEVGRLTVDLPTTEMEQAFQLLVRLQDDGTSDLGMPIEDAVAAPWNSFEEGMRVDIIQDGDKIVAVAGKKTPHRKKRQQTLAHITVKNSDGWDFLLKNDITGPPVKRLLYHLILKSWELQQSQTS